MEAFLAGPLLPILGQVEAIDSVAHVIQVALTPVFLLSGIGTLLNVFNMRLSRVSDHREHIAELLRGDVDDRVVPVLRAHLLRLRRRTLVLDVSLVSGAIGGASTCGAAFVLFLGGLKTGAVATWLYVLFGIALGCTVFALIAFLADSVLAWHGLRREGSMPSTGKH
jgi:hypothetical protein